VAIEPETYVLRIYRRGRARPRDVVGLIEIPDGTRQASFASLGELAAILAAPRIHLQAAAALSLDARAAQVNGLRGRGQRGR